MSLNVKSFNVLTNNKKTTHYTKTQLQIIRKKYFGYNKKLFQTKSRKPRRIKNHVFQSLIRYQKIFILYIFLLNTDSATTPRVVGKLNFPVK